MQLLVRANNLSSVDASCIVYRRLNRNRRLAKDFEATIKSAYAFLYAASAILPLRRLAR